MVILLLLLLVAFPASADVEIYKCVDEDGNVAYQQTPCPVAKKEPEEEPEEDAKEELKEEPEKMPESESAELPEQAEAIAAEDVTNCKQPLRDAIDEIEAEMLRGFSPEQGEEFKIKLRTLTQEMRACG